MRIRGRTNRLLGTAYSTPAAPPPVLLAPPLIPEPCPTSLISQDFGGFLGPATAPEGPCKLNRSPWELLDDLSDPHEMEDLLDNYYVKMDSHAYHLSSANAEVTSMKNKEATTMAISSSDKAQLQKSMKKKKKTSLKKATMMVNKEGQTQKSANVKKEEGKKGAAQTTKCKKNDGKGWKCPLNASNSNSLCEYHLMKKHSYVNLEFASLVKEEKVMVAAPTKASMLSRSSNAQKKKPVNNYDAIEGFYYYDGFGPSRGKRHCKNHPKKQEKVEVEPSKYASPLNHAKVETEDSTNNGTTTGGDDVSNNNNSCHDNVGMERNKIL